MVSVLHSGIILVSDACYAVTYQCDSSTFSDSLEAPHRSVCLSACLDNPGGNSQLITAS
jgi:hypothetical protein